MTLTDQQYAEIRKEFQAHPMLDVECPALTKAEVEALLAKPEGMEALLEYIGQRKERLALALRDPLQHGFELGHWAEVRDWYRRKQALFVFGGNGSAKTELGAKLTVERLCEGSGARVLCVARNDDDSKAIQQATIYRHLPPAAREYNEQAKKARGTVLKVNYSQADGFTGSSFVLPNKAQCWFKTVAQYLRDPISFEGPEYDLVWIDEGAPLSLVNTLRVRVGKRAGKLFFTFTAIHGIDAVGMEVLEGAKLVKSLPMQWDWALNDGAGGVNPAIKFPELKLADEQVKGVPKGHMPYIMQPMNFLDGLVFTWTQWNPFLPRSATEPAVPRVFDTVRGRARWQVRVRLFGWVEKLRGAAVGNFNPNIHVVAHAVIERMLKEKVMTTYMAMDPAGSRTAYCVWKGVAEDGTEYIFDELPRVDEGEWVSSDGVAGDGQSVYAGAGINWYKKIIREREREHGVEATRRFGDPRAFATSAAAAEGGITLFELFDRDGTAEDPDLAPMLFEPAKIRQTPTLDVELIVDKLAYNTDAEVSEMNKPKLFISDRCQNTIRCWLNYDGRAKSEKGVDNPWKDGVDASRYLFCEDTPFLDDKVPVFSGGGGWG